MYNYIFKKMVTWLQIEISLVIGMGLGVTKLVTNGYNGYKGSTGFNSYLFRFKRFVKSSKGST